MKNPSIFRFIYSAPMRAFSFSFALLLYVGVRATCLLKSAEFSRVPWLRVIGSEILVTIILLFTFGAVYGAYKRKYGVPPVRTRVVRNASELRK